MDVEIRILTKEDVDIFSELIIAFKGVFEREDINIPEQSHLKTILMGSNFFAFVAIKDGKVIGGLTAYVLQQYYSEKPLAYIYDLAVLGKYQCKGIGKKLIAEINRYCHEQGFEEVYVQADKEDDHALDFYRTTNPDREDEVVHFSYSLT